MLLALVAVNCVIKSPFGYRDAKQQPLKPRLHSSFRIPNSNVEILKCSGSTPASIGHCRSQNFIKETIECRFRDSTCSPWRHQPNQNRLVPLFRSRFAFRFSPKKTRIRNRKRTRKMNCSGSIDNKGVGVDRTKRRAPGGELSTLDLNQTFWPWQRGDVNK